jgi:hypothetical protein
MRTIYATHHPAWDAKNRHGLPDEFPMEYSYIAHIFNGSTQTAPTQEPVQNTSPAGKAIQQQVQEETQNHVEPPVPKQQNSVSNLNPAIPASLKDLMQQNGVSEEEIQAVVSQKGYYPLGTPIMNYDPNFIEGVLVGAWQQVYGMVVEFRKSLPF